MSCCIKVTSNFQRILIWPCLNTEVVFEDFQDIKVGQSWSESIKAAMKCFHSQ